LLLQDIGLGEDVELGAEYNRIMIRSASQSRQTWAGTFRSKAKDADSLLDEDLLTQTKWDEVEWEW
jgi:hypothetical protein